MKGIVKIFIIVSSVILITIIYAVCWFKKHWVPLEEECVALYEKVPDESFSGTVIQKFVDRHNHGANTIVLKNEDDTLKLGMPNDVSGLYEYLGLNDSVEKNLGSYEVSVFKKSVLDTIFVIDFDCELYSKP